MSIRETLLALLAKNTIMTLDEIQDATGEQNRKRLSDNLKAAIRDELVTRLRDDVTGQPAYQLTESGKYRAQATACQDQEETGMEAKPRPEDQDQSPTVGLLMESNKTLNQRLATATQSLENWQKVIGGITGCTTPEDAAAYFVEAKAAAEQAEKLKALKTPINYGHVWDGGFTQFDTERQARQDVEKAMLEGSTSQSYLVAVLGVAEVRINWKEAA